MSRNSKLVAVLTVLVTLAACSRSARFYRDKGDKFAASGKYYDAALNYRKAIQKDARDGEAFFGLGSGDIRRECHAGCVNGFQHGCVARTVVSASL